MTPVSSPRRRPTMAGPRVFAAALMLTVAGCGQDGREAAEPPPPGVLVAKVQNRAISETVEYVGRTVAVNDVSLRAQVEGYLLERRFAEGDDIEHGAELFVIDPALYQAGVAAAEGEVAQTKAALARANKDLARYTQLIQKQNVSRQKLDEAESDKLQQEANLKSAEAKLQRAQIDLSHTVIRAPFEGRVGRSAVSVGALVTPQSEELARLVQLDPIYANFSVSERDVIAAKRKLRQPGGGDDDPARLEVTLRLPDGSTYEHLGRLDFIDNVVDRRTGTVVLRAKFANPDKLLVPGLYVSTLLGREETLDKLVIPQAAVQEDQAGVFVMVVGPDNKVEQRRIETGQAFAGELVVNAGLEPDEQVIVEGIQKVRPGLVVEPKMAPRPTTQTEDREKEATAEQMIEPAQDVGSGPDSPAKPEAQASGAFEVVPEAADSSPGETPEPTEDARPAGSGDATPDAKER